MTLKLDHVSRVVVEYHRKYKHIQKRAATRFTITDTEADQFHLWQ